MNRSRFLTISAVTAFLVAIVAVVFPHALLESKGVAITPAVVVWMREVGVLIAGQGVVAMLVRAEPDSRALRAILVGSAVVQFGLLPIEIAALDGGSLTAPSGVIPNSIVHVVLGVGFVYFAARVRTGTGARATSSPEAAGARS